MTPEQRKAEVERRANQVPEPLTAGQAVKLSREIRYSSTGLRYQRLRVVRFEREPVYQYIPEHPEDSGWRFPVASVEEIDPPGVTPGTQADHAARLAARSGAVA